MIMLSELVNMIFFIRQKLFGKNFFIAKTNIKKNNFYKKVRNRDRKFEIYFS